MAYMCIKGFGECDGCGYCTEAEETEDETEDENEDENEEDEE